MAVEMLKPYVISSDLKGLMSRWSKSSGYTLPEGTFFKAFAQDLESVLKSYYPGVVEIISEEEISSGLESFAAKTEYPIVSLDRAYVSSDTPNIQYFFDATRGVDENLEGIGLIARPGFPPLEVQIKKICEQQGPICLLDDVIFSGDDLCKFVIELEKRGRPVKKVFTGVAIAEGANKLKNLGVEVQAVREYDDVVDEVCERDYYAGAPMSGRMVMKENKFLGTAPYFKPFGDPFKWASIPKDRIHEFSQFCLNQSLTLWMAIEKESQVGILTHGLPRRLFGVPENVSIITVLKHHIDKLQE